MGYDTKTALLAGIIDYAGTFPPAALPLADALYTGATFRSRARHPWLIGRYTLPLADLKTIEPKTLYGAGSAGEPWIFTALGNPPQEKGAAAFLRSVEWDLREVERFNERHFHSSLRSWICAYELKIPVEAFAGGMSTLHDFLMPVLERFQVPRQWPVAPYWEVGWEEGWRSHFDALAAVLSEWLERQEVTAIVPGIKVRTGGAYVPTAEQLARAVQVACDGGFRFKATQGLHHAVTQNGAWGFVNLFAALTYYQALGSEAFPQLQIERCLAESQASHFCFDTEALVWNDHRLTVETIEQARRRHGGAFGSCSADEPDESLAVTFPKKGG